MLSQAVEDYLKTIYKLQSDGTVSTTEIARSMGVSSASVTNMCKKLAEGGFLTHQSYRGVELTEAGEKIALEIIRHHRLLETYLREIMGYGWEKMHEEAEHLEHHISEEFEDRLDEMLGYPTHDPHGDPIPSRDGTISTHRAHPLTTFASGTRVRIHRIPDDDLDLLHTLEAAGLLPGAIAVYLGEEGSDAIAIDTGGERHRFGADTATRILAEDAS